jgi:hypothetical protein
MPWSFLAGKWTMEAPDGTIVEISCELADSKNCYVIDSEVFHGILGVDSSSDKPMLILGYHPEAGFSLGHWKRSSKTVVEGGFWFVNADGVKTEHTSRWEKTPYGYTYTIDDGSVWHWRRK